MIEACILNLRQQGSIDEGRARLFTDTYREILKTMKGSMADAAAQAAATDATMRAVAAENALKKRRVALKYQTRKAIVANIQNSGADLDHAVLAHFDFDERATGISNIEGRRKAVLGKLHSMMAEVLEQFDRTLLGNLKRPALMLNVVREAFGQDTGDAAAKQLAAAWGEAAEYARMRANRAGANIGRLENWGMPQVHDAVKVKAAGFRKWRADILPMLDLGRMLDHETGEMLTPRRLNSLLRETYDSIITSGWDDRTLGGRGNGAMARRREQHRFLIFRDADQWLQYQQAFGAGDTKGAPEAMFDVMMGHMDAMARDIAAMEILGPDPDATVRWLSDMLKKAAATDALPEGRVVTADSRAAFADYTMRNMYGLFTGELNRPVNAQMARTFSALRAIQTSAKLGSAQITAITDIGFQATTRDFLGLPVAKVIGDYIAWMAPKVKAGEKAIAIRAGLLAEETASRLSALSRYQDEFNAPAWARRLADGVLRASGLSRWTQVGKWLFGMDMFGQLADNAGRAFADIDEGLRLSLRRHGISPADWDAIRQVAAYEHGGVRWLRPDDVRTSALLDAGEAERLSDLLLEMVQTETRYAVPDAGLRARAITTGDARPGTWGGELWRSMMQFKAFPVSILFTHITRAVHGDGMFNRSEYAAKLFISTTLMGMLAHQTTQLLTGRDPAPMDDWRTWAAAAAKGGGAGILGDFLFADQNRYGGGLAATLSGPLLGSVEGLAKLTWGNIQNAADGKDSNLGRELVRFARSNTPGSSLWYARAAFDRVLWGNLQRWVDPDYEQAIERMERRAARETGQEYWWKPDETMPSGTPDFSNLDGGEQ